MTPNQIIFGFVFGIAIMATLAVFVVSLCRLLDEIFEFRRGYLDARDRDPQLQSTAALALISLMALVLVSGAFSAWLHGGLSIATAVVGVAGWLSIAAIAITAIIGIVAIVLYKLHLKAKFSQPTIIYQEFCKVAQSPEQPIARLTRQRTDLVRHG